MRKKNNIDRHHRPPRWFNDSLAKFRSDLGLGLKGEGWETSGEKEWPGLGTDSRVFRWFTNAILARMNHGRRNKEMTADYVSLCRGFRLWSVPEMNRYPRYGTGPRRNGGQCEKCSCRVVLPRLVPWGNWTRRFGGWLWNVRCSNNIFKDNHISND